MRLLLRPGAARRDLRPVPSAATAAIRDSACGHARQLRGPARRRAREDPGVDVPPRAELIGRIRALPAARPLLEQLADVPGLYVVGGAVRDLLLGRQPRELDLVVEGDAAAVASRLGGSRRVHDRFGTVTVTLDGRTYDIARARKETYARPGALPDVEPARLEDDLWRRDFSVNAG